MPIYAYKCDSCGHQKDALQKVSDPVLTVCPSCGAEAFRKQLTAAGFQLKGSGWYVTDFRGGNAATAKKADEPSGSGEAKPAAESGKSADASTKPPSETATAAAPAAPAAPTAATGAASAPAPPSSGTP